MELEKCQQYECRRRESKRIDLMRWRKLQRFVEMYAVATGK